MKVVISQPRYLPALNYLQRLFFSDNFVVLDVVQRQARGWENRNKLLIPSPSWLTVPVSSSSRALIKDSFLDGTDWIDEHKKKISFHYRAAPYFDPKLLDQIYILSDESNQYTDILVAMLRNACRLLSFEPKLVFASDLLKPEEFAGGGVEILRRLSERVGAKTYVSGPNGRAYGVIQAFAGSEIGVRFHEFQHPIYDQLSKPFTPYMGYLDALFCCGVEWLSDFVRTKPDLRDCNG